jgi:RNA 2',3'-cyclic 3'-phosphodiesterase
MRLFVAAEPSEAVRRAASAVSGRLRAALESRRMGDGLRWVPEQNLHLTVWFLGEVSDNRAAAVLDTLRPPVGVPPFTLHLSGLGAFPPSGPPRVYWLGVARGGEELARIHDDLGTRLAPWGFEGEGRPYSAHLTLARVKEAPAAAARAVIRQLLRDTDADAGSCQVEALTVFRSRTSPRGAAYEPLLRVPLG